MRATALFFVVLPLVPSNSSFSHRILALDGAAMIRWDWWKWGKK